MTKNDDHKVELLNNYLGNKAIALCVTGGIAAIETPKIARQLRRYGAEVKVYLTGAAQQVIGKSALDWGTGQSIVTELSGLAEHLCREAAVLV
ncbi:MAG: flavoprotein, partial [Nanoarchaeota archaeon]